MPLRARLTDVLTQLLRFNGYPRTLNGLRMVDEVTAPQGIANHDTPNGKKTS